MTQSTDLDTSEVKTIYRAIEDQRELRVQMRIDKELALRDLEAHKLKVNLEMNYNNQLNQKLEQMSDINKEEKEKFETMSTLQSTLAKGNLTKVVSFSVDSVEKYKAMTKAKQVDFAKKLNQHIEDYTKKRPLVLHYNQKEELFAQMQQQLQTNREEKIMFAERAKKETQVNGLLFEQNVVEMAHHVLRYYNNVDKLKNPNKPTHRAVPLKPMLKMTMHKQVREPIQEYTDQQMSEPSGISTQQQPFESIEDDEVPTFDRNSVARGGMKQKKTGEKKDQARDQRPNEVANKEKPKMVPKAQSFLNKSTARESSQDKEMFNSEPPKYPKHPSASSLKVSEVASQNTAKPRKAKVTFVDPKPSSSFKMDTFGDDEGFSSFKPTSTKSMNMESFSEDENDIQMNNNEEEDIQMDEENAAEQEQSGKTNKSPSYEEMDDDQISNWTSLEVPSGNRADNNRQANSPQSKASSFDLDYPSIEANFPKNSNNSKFTSKDAFFSFDDDMAALFG